MKKLTTVLLVITVIAGNTSCKKDQVGSGPVTTQTRTVTGFTGIDLRMNGNVYYTNDTAWKVEVSAKQSIHSILRTDVVNSMLVIRYNDDETYDNDESIRINVLGPGLNKFNLNTSGRIFCENNIQTTNLSLRSSGSGDITLKNVIANSIDAASTQSGTIRATGGTADSEVLNSDASGKIELSAIAAKQVTARTIGSGNISVKVSDMLNATINGSGSVYFSGYPVLTSSVSGSGRIIRF
jgi:carbon monoxide dehydrogenase subunit G